MHLHDLIGIGFGPSNVALAIALDEQRPHGTRFDALFIERQPTFSWHPGMLLEHAHMQISFLKDLATLRNPTSRFSFINYLHERRRLVDFINLKTFYPSRHEFSDYLGWAAAQFEDQCHYGEEVFEVLPVGDAGREVSALRVRSRDAQGRVRERLARNLVVGLGGTARIPAGFEGLRDDPRVFHSSTYLRDVERLQAAPPMSRIALIGAGQSAAEIFMDLHGRADAPQVDLVMRARALRPSDDSPFVNEVFNAEAVDHMYAQPQAGRDALLREYRHTNYACPDLELIQQIYTVFYDQKVQGTQRHRLLTQQEIGQVQAGADGIHLALKHRDTGRETRTRYDAVVLATGYEREHHKALLAPLTPFLGDFTVDRHYRVRSPANFHPGVFLQGACEPSHGLSDTLLSLIAVRTGEICDALLHARTAARHEAVRVA